MSKRLIMCILKDSQSDIDLVKSSRIDTDLTAAVASIEQEGCSAFTTSFDKGGQYSEILAYSVMTMMEDEKIKALIEPICNKYYNVHILR